MSVKFETLKETIPQDIKKFAKRVVIQNDKVRKGRSSGFFYQPKRPEPLCKEH